MPKGTRVLIIYDKDGIDLPAGVIAELYRRRWDVEKVFDQIKNKLGEKKAWGTSLEAKATQRQLVALTHNLLLRYEARLEREHGVSNEAEDQRRQELQRETRQAGNPLTTLRTGLRRAMQRSVKLIRCCKTRLCAKTLRKKLRCPASPFYMAPCSHQIWTPLAKIAPLNAALLVAARPVSPSALMRPNCRKTAAA